jgi:hypothetical protein
MSYGRFQTKISNISLKEIVRLKGKRDGGKCAYLRLLAERKGKVYDE